MEIKSLYTKQGENGCDYAPVYPRPLLVRDSFFSLDGEWELYIGKTHSGEYDRKIKVPFCPESLLSGVHRNIEKGERLFYKKSFSLPDGFVRDRVLLHFGAVDCISTVYMNGERLATHEGGYHTFSLDVTCALVDGENTLTLTVDDELSQIYPYGKQRRDRGGMWYTPVSGIWQSVWMESVCENYVKGLKIDTDATGATIYADGVREGELSVDTENGKKIVSLVDGVARVEIESPRMWSPEDPYLYEFTLSAGRDEVRSYFALRTLEIKDIDGHKVLCLNGEPYYFHALLDQGYFSDGIYTPASHECYEQDIAYAKRMGFNTLRKHIKIEPEIFYYYCDKLGMVVFQDMVNNGNYSFLRDTALPTFGLQSFAIGKSANPKKLSRERFECEMEMTVRQLYNHPCICYWTIFNEGWGQFDADTMYERLKKLDSTRFIDTASGWFKPKKSDVESLHVYFKRVKLKRYDKPVVLSEFGGYSYKIPEHSFNQTKTYGYGKFTDCEEFHLAVERLYEEEIIPAIECGLCADVYTQISDVEDETNGMYTYDRRVEKADATRMKAIADKLCCAFQNFWANKQANK